MNDMPKYIELLRDVYHRALLDFTLYQRIMISCSPKHIGKKQAKQNVESINKYRGVFVTARIATRYTSLMGLAVLFIEGHDRKGNPSASFPDLLERLKASELTSEQKHELRLLEKRLKKYESKRESLKALRDQYLAHLDLKPKTVTLTDKDIESLLSFSSRAIALAEWYFIYTDIRLDDYRHNAKSRIAAEDEVVMDLDALLGRISGV